MNQGIKVDEAFRDHPLDRIPVVPPIKLSDARQARRVEQRDQVASLSRDLGEAILVPSVTAVQDDLTSG